MGDWWLRGLWWGNGWGGAPKGVIGWRLSGWPVDICWQGAATIFFCSLLTMRSLCPISASLSQRYHLSAPPKGAFWFLVFGGTPSILNPNKIQRCFCSIPFLFSVTEATLTPKAKSNFFSKCLCQTFLDLFETFGQSEFSRCLQIFILEILNEISILSHSHLNAPAWEWNLVGLQRQSQIHLQISIAWNSHIKNIHWFL